MSNVIFNSFKKNLMNGSFDLDNDTFKVMLVKDTYTPNQDTHEFISEIQGDEVSGQGYTAGGKVLANLSVSQDNTDDEGVWDADDVLWENSTITAKGAVIYKDTGDANTSPIISYIDFGENKSSDNGDFQLTWNSEGILNVN